MRIATYDDLNDMQRDALKEICSIGTGNAATSLSSMLSLPVSMTVPDVKVLGFNESVDLIGDPEEIIAGILVSMSGEINGIMLYMLKLDFINMIINQLMGHQLKGYEELGDMERSALEEIGNIIISSYVNALSSLTTLHVDLSVPAIAINMLGAIMTVPMAEMGYMVDKIMIIDGKFECNGLTLSSHLLMVPDIDSLNYLMEKLGMSHG